MFKLYAFLNAAKEKLNGWKTVLFNASIIIVALSQFAGVIQPMLSPTMNLLFIIAVSLANIALRYYTTGKIFGM